jgi:glycosyltransferase involved in cell wall biosynthesis
MLRFYIKVLLKALLSSMHSKRLLFLEPFFGGSHRDFAEGLIEHSKHSIDLHTLPARFWKWRLRGAALHFANIIKNPEKYDALITCDMLSLSDLKALWGAACPPTLVYFHENQLTYPLAPGETMDLQYGFTDITTALAADRILFNSKSHYNAFFENLPGFLQKMPEYRPRWVINAIRKKSSVLYPGCRFDPETEIMLPKQDEIPLIIWNHRWEFDKNPILFFDTLEKVSGEGVQFRLALLGENHQVMPREFIAAKDRFGDRIEQYGFVASKEEYFTWLKRGSIVVSTADQENFGISIVEAIRHGCAPLLPNRLSYPELIPQHLHDDFLYRHEDELLKKLLNLITELSQPGNHWLKKIQILAQSMNRYSWQNLIVDYDREIDTLLEK